MKKKGMIESLKEDRNRGRKQFSEASVEGRTYLQLESMENGLRSYRDAILMTRGGIGLALFLIVFLTFTVSLVMKGLTGFTFGVLAVSLIVAILTVTDVLRVVFISSHILDRIAQERDYRVKEVLHLGDEE